MPFGSRGGKQVQPVAARLLLGRPGSAPDPKLPTQSRAVVAGPGGDRTVESVAAEARGARAASKGDKALLGLLASDDVAGLVAEAGADASGTTQLLLGLRLAGADPLGAVRALGPIVEARSTPWEGKVVRRHLPDLAVHTLLAPGVPVVVPVGREATVLLLAEMLGVTGHHLDSVSLLANEPRTPLVSLALAAAFLAAGQNESTIELTDGVVNADDLTALCLVARGVALRSVGRYDESLAAFDDAVGAPGRHPGIVLAGLAERANVLQVVGDEGAAAADRERITAIESGRPLEEVGSSAPFAPPPGERWQPTAVVDPVADEEADAMAVARARVRRRLSGTGEPGTFGGRHHRTYIPEVEAMLGAGQVDPAESLLLGLLDAVEDEVDAATEPSPVDPTFFLTLADLFADKGKPLEARAVIERLEELSRHHGVAGVELEGEVVPPAGPPGPDTIPDRGHARV